MKKAARGVRYPGRPYPGLGNPMTTVRPPSHPGKAGLSAPSPDCFEINRRIRRSGLSYAAQALLCAILDHDRYGQSLLGCTASLATLANEIGATPQYVSRLLLPLLEGG